MKAGGETLVCMIDKHVNSVWNKEELPDQWKEFIIVPVHKYKQTKTNSVVLSPRANSTD
jgi:hypothetical protein